MGGRGNAKPSLWPKNCTPTGSSWMTAPGAAAQRNLTVIGTLGVLVEAAEHGLMDLSDAITRLQKTSFYVSPIVLNALLQRYGRKR